MNDQILKLNPKVACNIFLSFLLCFLFTSVSGQISYEMDSLLIKKAQSEEPNVQKPFASFWSKNVSEPMRISLMHEVSAKVKAPAIIRTNRSSVQLEYMKCFLNHFSAQFDTKFIGNWNDDHQTRAVDKDFLFKTRIKEAFLQTSFGHTSVKAGIQCLIWGESDVGAITDIVSPRNLSEWVFCTLEESRKGQPMLTIDQYSKIGDWSFFFTPKPDFDEYPAKGTAYLSSLVSDLKVPDLKLSSKYFEFGMRWKKTIGPSDISFMAASLIDNAYYLGTHRMKMVGTTFNYAAGIFMIKGESALKMPVSYNILDEVTNTKKVKQKNIIETSLALDYTPGGTFSASLEGVNSHIIGWEYGLRDFPQDFYNLVLNLNDKFFHEYLTVNLMTNYMISRTCFLNFLTISYKWSDKVNFNLIGCSPTVRDSSNHIWRFRDQKMIKFQIQYQF